jgi:hypothetical protein
VQPGEAINHKRMSSRSGNDYSPYSPAPALTPRTAVKASTSLPLPSTAGSSAGVHLVQVITRGISRVGQRLLPQSLPTLKVTRADLQSTSSQSGLEQGTVDGPERRAAAEPLGRS